MPSCLLSIHADPFRTRVDRHDLSRALTPKTTVEVYRFHLDSGHAQNLLNAFPFDATSIDIAIKRAVAIWNEDSGSSIKLRFRGITANFTKGTASAPAVVLVSRTDVCSNAFALSFPNVPPPANVYVNGQIEFRKFSTASSPPSSCPIGLPPSNPPIPWCLAPSGSCIDITTVLIHEIGHHVFNMDHPDNASNPDCENLGQSVMLANFNPNNRQLKPYDLEIAQGRYGPRSAAPSGVVALVRKTHMTSPTTWTTPSIIDGAGAFHPLYRFGSMSTGINKRAYPLLSAVSVQDGGTGSLTARTYGQPSSTAQALGDFASGQIRGRPVALASKSTTDALLVYFKGTNLYNNDFPAVCYRRSSNSGVSWGFESCTTSGSFVSGVSVAFDPFSNAYLIGFRGATSPTDLSIHLLTVPAVGSLTPSVQTELSVSGVSFKSFHAPSVACSGASDGCRVVFEGSSSTAPLSWLRVGVTPITGEATVFQSLSQGLQLYDTPSVVYSTGDSTFRLAITTDNNAIYSYKMTSVGTTWQGTGDIFNTPTAQVSTGTLATRFMSVSEPSRLYGWFNQYW